MIHQVTNFSSINWDEWNELVFKSEYGTIYHSATWFRSLEELFPEALFDYHIWYRNQQLVAIAAFLNRRHLRVAQGIKGWSTFYASPIFCDTLSTEDVLRAIADLAQVYDKCEMIFQPSAAKLLTLPWTSSDRVTFLLALDSDSEKRWKNTTSHTRNSVRKALKENCVVVRDDDPSLLAHLYFLTYQRQEVELPFSKVRLRDFFVSIVNEFDAAIHFVRNQEGVPCNGLLVAKDRKRSYALFSGSDHRAERSGSGSLLWWETINFVSARSTELDMIGAGTPGIRRFKRNFNPEEVTIPELAVSRSGWSALKVCSLEAGRKAKNYLFR